MNKDDVVWIWWDTNHTYGRRVYFQEEYRTGDIKFKYEKHDDWVISSSTIGTGWCKMNCIDYKPIVKEEPPYDVTETGELQYRMF